MGSLGQTFDFSGVTLRDDLDDQTAAPTNDFDDDFGAEPEAPSRWITRDQIMAMPDMKWRVKGVCPTRGLGQIYGESGSGKSFLAIDMAVAIAEGREWFGHRVLQGPVAIMALEGGAGIKKRIIAWEKENERQIPGSVKLTLEPFDITDPGQVAAAAHHLEKGTTVYVDTLAQASSGRDENSSKDMGLILAGAAALAAAVCGMVVLVAHTGKDLTKKARGHSSQKGAADFQIEVRANGGGQKSWALEKAKDDVTGGEHGFELKSVFLGTDEDGDNVTSCVIHSTGRVAAKPKPPGKHDHLVLGAYFAALHGGHWTAGEDGSVLGVCPVAWRGEFDDLAEEARIDHSRVVWRRVFGQLKADGKITEGNGWWHLAGQEGWESEAAEFGPGPAGVEAWAEANRIRQEQEQAEKAERDAATRAKWDIDAERKVNKALADEVKAKARDEKNLAIVAKAAARHEDSTPAKSPPAKAPAPKSIPKKKAVKTAPKRPKKKAAR